MLGWYLQNPIIAVVVTAAIFMAVMLLTRRVPSPAADPAPTARRFGAASGAVLFAAFAVVYAAMISGLFFEPWAYQWWQYPLPLIVGTVALIVITVVLWARRTTVEAPVHPVRRRDWWSFSSRGDLAALAAVVGVTALTCVIAGSNSDWMTIDLPSGGGYATFFGWAYGIPVLIGTVLVGGLTVVALRVNSQPPFSRPESAPAETAARRLMAMTIARVSIAAMLLPLGGALISIGQTAGSRGGFGIPGVGDFMFNYGFASLMEPLLIAGRGCEIAAVVLVFLLFVGGAREWKFARRAATASQS